MLLDGYYYYMWQCTSIRMSGGLQFKGALPPSLWLFALGFICVSWCSASRLRFPFYLRCPLRLHSIWFAGLYYVGIRRRRDVC